ncbi:MAG TPA: sigma-70 factor domain-containing protein, partial [Dehalococcoidia bacterium]
MPKNKNLSRTDILERTEGQPASIAPSNVPHGRESTRTKPNLKLLQPVETGPGAGDVQPPVVTPLLGSRAKVAVLAPLDDVAEPDVIPGKLEEEEEEEEEEEPEKSVEAGVPIEEQEGIDDPVRMYLREIGKVSLLSADDEKRLARQMEEGKHITRLEQSWQQSMGRPARTADVVYMLFMELADLEPIMKSIMEYAGTTATELARIIGDPAFRKVIDGEMDLEAAEKVRQDHGYPQDEQLLAEHAIVRLSIVTHILNPADGGRQAHH